MKPTILTTGKEIEDFAAELQKETCVAVDLEADALHNYQEKVCLLQFTTSARTLLIDPLPVGSLQPLAPVLADTGVRKIFHAADYDLRCLRRDFGFEIRGLFDTMIGAQFCGEEKIGLADLLRKYFGVELDKRFQKADWSLRPLPEDMANYAAEDTRHLHRLAELIENRLIELGRLEWLHEECLLLEQVRFAEHDGPLFMRFKGAGTLERRQLAVLEALLQWRDGEAMRRNRPLFKVIGNAQLLELAKQRPKDRAGLKAVPGLAPVHVERYGRDLLAAVAAAEALPNDELPVYPRERGQERDPEVDRRLKKLKGWRQLRAAEMELDPGVLINNATLEQIARRQPEGLEQLTAIPGMRTWQVQALGRDLLLAC